MNEPSPKLIPLTMMPPDVLRTIDDLAGRIQAMRLENGKIAMQLRGLREQRRTLIEAIGEALDQIEKARNGGEVQLVMDLVAGSHAKAPSEPSAEPSQEAPARKPKTRRGRKP